MTLQGGCFCGAVRYVIDGDTFNSTLCHCSDCRRSAGVPAVAWVSAAMDGFRFSQGNAATFHSSEHVLRSFCATCGTTLTYQDNREPDELDIATATLDDPAAIPLGDHTFVKERLPWMQSHDGLPEYPGARSEGQGT